MYRVGGAGSGRAEAPQSLDYNPALTPEKAKLDEEELMGNVGIIVRAEGGIGGLAADWTPPTLGARAEVENAVASLFVEANRLMLRLLVESRELSEDPRCISVSGSWGNEELKLLKTLCDRFGAKMYDAAEGEFLDL
jgi:hypothetical protein